MAIVYARVNPSSQQSEHIRVGVVFTAAWQSVDVDAATRIAIFSDPFLQASDADPGGSSGVTINEDNPTKVRTYSSLIKRPAAAVFGAGICQIGGVLSVSDGSSWGNVGSDILLPSGGDDAPQMMAAIAANRGTLKLGPGRFKPLTPLVAEGIVNWRKLYNVVYGAKVLGSGMGATIIDCSGMDQNILKIHDRHRIVGITNTSPALVTLDASTPLPVGANWEAGEIRAIDGTSIWFQTPASTIALANSMESINGISSASQKYYIKKLTTTTFEVYTDANLATPLNLTNTTLHGSFGNQSVTETGISGSPTWNTAQSWNMFRYYGNYNYVPAIRFVGVETAPNDRNVTMNIEMRDLTLTNLADDQHIVGMNYNGIGVGIENNFTIGTGGNADTRTSQNNHFTNVKIDGFRMAGNFDDCTNLMFMGVDFQGNPIACGAGYVFDIVTFLQCRFGDDRFIANAQRQQVLQIPPVYYAPANTYYPAPSRVQSVNFQDNWYMGCHDVAGDTNSDQIFFTGTNYFEQVRTVAQNFGGKTFSSVGSQFSDHRFGINLKNNEVILGAGQEIELALNVGKGAAKFGWIGVVHNNSDETVRSNLKWKNNQLKAGVPSPGTQDRGHIRYNFYDGVNGQAPRYILLSDNNTTGVNNYLGRGYYEFIGADLVGGNDLIAYNSAVTGTYKIVLEQYNTHVLTLTGNTNFVNIVSAIDKSGVINWKTNHRGAGSVYYGNNFRIKPLRLILTQDATGGRAITFDTAPNPTDYVVSGLVDGSAALPGQKSILEFVWDGANFRLTKQTPWA